MNRPRTAATRHGNKLKVLRTELRKLDDSTLLKRLTRYTGRTVREERQRCASWGRTINRALVMDIIANYEVPQ